MKRSTIFLIVVLACTGTLSAQSLADLARQERERKKNTESKITLTNDSVRPAPAPEPEVKPEAKGVAKDQKPAETKPAAGAPTKPVRDEKYWRDTFAQAREELKRAETQVEVQQIRLNQAHRDLLLKSDQYNKEQVVGAELNAANADLEAARINVERAKQKISSLEDELRRSGGLPGWAR